MPLRIVDDEQRSDHRATPMRPLGSVGAGASAALALLDDVQRHRLRRAVESRATRRWHRYIDEWADVIGLDHFGSSAPGLVLMREYGFTAEIVCKRALALLEKNSA